MTSYFYSCFAKLPWCNDMLRQFVTPAYFLSNFTETLISICNKLLRSCSSSSWTVTACSSLHQLKQKWTAVILKSNTEEELFPIGPNFHEGILTSTETYLKLQIICGPNWSPFSWKIWLSKTGFLWSLFNYEQRLYVQVSTWEMLHIQFLVSQHYKMLINTMMGERISLSIALTPKPMEGQVKFRTPSDIYGAS